MMVLILFILIVGIVLTSLAIAYYDPAVKVVAGSLGLIFTGLTMYASGEKDAYENSLKGNNPYKMEIRYEFKDSIYIPKDTVFTKIEK